MSRVFMAVDGEIFDNWMRVSIKKQLDALCGSFSFEAINAEGIGLSKWKIRPGAQVQIYIDEMPVMSGYIDRLEGSYSPHTTRISAAGRDLTADLVDSSVDDAHDEFLHQSLGTIATSLCRPYGITVNDESQDAMRFPVWKVDPGESVFETLERASRQRSIVIRSDGFGAIGLSRLGGQRSDDKLIEGENILEASVSYDHSARYHTYIVRAQNFNKEDGDRKHHIEERSEDNDISRHRNLTIFAEGSADKEAALQRARWEKSVRKARSMTMSVSVQGWKQSSGRLWNVGELVAVYSPYLNITGDLLIISAEFSFDASDGTLTRLNLTHKDAYQTEIGRLI